MAKKTGLGKGLDALFANNVEEENMEVNEKVLNLNIVGNFNKNIEGNESDIGLYTYNVFNKKFDDYNNFVHYLNC